MSRVSLPLITNSECTTYRRCAREHHIAYTLGVRPVARAEALEFGTLIHKALEAWWIWHATPDSMWSDALGPALNAMSDVQDPFVAKRAYAMIAGYHLRWSDDALRIEVRGVEQQFTAPLINPATGHPSTAYQLGGKLDVVVKDERGDTWIYEHKTSAQDITPGSTYWPRLRLDSQVSTYMVGARALGYQPRGVVYDVLGKPGQEPKAIPIVEDGAKVVLDANGARVRTKDGKKWRETADKAEGYVLQTRPETPEEYGARVREAIAAEPDAYYQRAQVVRLQEEEREAAADTWQIVARIRESRRTGIAPRNPDACMRYGRMCSYFEACSGETSLDNPLRYTRVSNVHQELSLEEAAE